MRCQSKCNFINIYLLLFKNPLKKFNLPVFLALIFIFTGCISGGADLNPKNALSSFFDALSIKNFYKAKSYTTGDSEGMMNMAQLVMQNIPDSSQQLYFGTNNLVLGNAVINGDYATVPVKNKNSDKPVDFSLRKVNGQWKVSMNISTVLQMTRQQPEFSQMNDSLSNLNTATGPGTQTMTLKEMRDARKKMDSINNELNRKK
jgi:hypothetical protein